jgi:hypothetical protein
MTKESVLRSVVRVDMSRAKAKIRAKKTRETKRRGGMRVTWKSDQRINMTMSAAKKKLNDIYETNAIKRAVTIAQTMVITSVNTQSEVDRSIPASC